jgi:hypothetical protein
VTPKRSGTRLWKERCCRLTWARRERPSNFATSLSQETRSNFRPRVAPCSRMHWINALFLTLGV